METQITSLEREYVYNRFRSDMINGTTWKIPITVSESTALRWIVDMKFKQAVQRIRGKLGRLPQLKSVYHVVEITRELNELETDMKSICDDRFG